MKRNLILAATLLLAGLSASAQKLSPLTRLALSEAREGIQTKSVATQTQTVEAFVHLTDASAVAQIQALGGQVHTTVSDRLVTASLPLQALAQIADIEGVEYIQAGTEARLLMDKARADANVDACHSGVDDKGAFTGKGIVVGIVDQGFQYTHTDFMTTDGTATRVRRVWNQNASAGNSPEGYGYGTEYKTFDEMKAARYDETSGFHATHVTGIAAGADKNTAYYGVAPDADLVLVSFGSTNANIVDGINYCFDYAKSVGKPCVVNISLGSHYGPHDGTSSTDLALSALTGPGRIIVGAAGNEGGQNIHAAKTFTDTDQTMKVMIGYPETSSSTRTAYIDAWGSVGSDISVKTVVVDAMRGRVLAESPAVSAKGDTQTTDYTFPEGNDVTCRVKMEAVEDPTNGRTEVAVMCRISSISDNRKMALVITGESGATVHLWNNASGGSFLASGKSGWTDGDDACTVGELGGTCPDVISVGSYNSRSNYSTLDGYTYDINTNTVGLLGDISSFSSLGPTADDRTKPDVAAPGCPVISATSLYYVGLSTSSAAAKSGSDYYDVNYGTSMASPFVAGTVALWLQANPTLTPTDVRNLLYSSSRHDDYTGEASTTDCTWGAGKIDALEGVRQALVYSGIEESALTDPLLSVETDRTARTATFRYVEGREPARVTIYNALGQLLASHTLKASGQTVSLPATGEGVLLVRLQNGQSVKTVKTLM